MKLSSLTFRNYCGLDDVTLELHPGTPVIISGPNGSGKSSLLSGLEWLLTGKAPTNGPLLREGQSSGYVAGVFANSDEARRNINPHSLEIEGLPKKAGANAAQERLMALAGVPSGTDVGRALRPDIFLQLTAKEQSASWYEILGIRVDKDAIEAQLTNLEAVSGLAIRAEFDAANDDRVSTNLDGTYKRLFAARRDKKRDLKAETAVLADIEKAEEDGKAPVFKQPPSAELLAAKRAELQQLSQQMGAVLSSQARRKAQLAKAAEMEQALKELFDDARISRNESVLAGLRNEVSALDNPRTRLAAKRREIAAAGGACCPTCGRDWDDAEDRAVRAMQLTQQEADILVQVEKEAALLARISDGEKLLRRQADLRRTKAALADLRADMQAVGKDCGTDLDAQIDRVRQQLAALDEQAADANASTAWITRKAEASSRVATLTKSVAALEELVTLFGDGPTSIKATILRAAVEPVGDQLTATLSEWGMAARLSDDLVLEIERFGGWRPVSACSDGEVAIVALALQVWLAEHSGTRVILIDRVEAVDVENRQILLSAVSQLLESGAIDHAFLAGVELGDAATLTLNTNPILLEV